MTELLKNTNQFKRHIASGLGFIEKQYDMNISSESYYSDAIKHIKGKYQISHKHEILIEEVLTSVLDHAAETESALDEFNLSLSGVCDTCSEVILYGQDGITDEGENDYCCTICSIKKETSSQNRDYMINNLTDYGKLRLTQNNNKDQQIG